jgi:hypothetical protein
MYFDRYNLMANRRFVAVVAAVPNLKVDELKRLPTFVDERTIPDMGGNLKTWRWTNNPELYEIYYNEAGILRYHYFTDKINNDAIRVLIDFIRNNKVDANVPNNAFINVSYVFSTTVNQSPDLYGAIIAPAMFLERNNVGLTRGMTSYGFKIANQTYDLVLKAMWESVVIHVELSVVYNTQSVVGLDTVLPHMLEVLGSEYGILSSRIFASAGATVQ